MRIRRYSHACVRLETDGGRIVIDPGEWSEPEAMAGADAVLLTHFHSDHFDTSKVAGTEVPVFGPGPGTPPGTTVVGAGDSIVAAGSAVEVVGGRHARVVPTADPVPNVGYLVPGEWYHPGDALHVPDAAVRVLFLAMQASWLKTSEAIDFANAVAPELAVGIHDGQLNERGIDAINSWFAAECRCDYRWLAPGADLRWPSSG